MQVSIELKNGRRVVYSNVKNITGNDKAVSLTFVKDEYMLEREISKLNAYGVKALKDNYQGDYKETLIIDVTDIIGFSSI